MQPGGDANVQNPPQKIPFQPQFSGLQTNILRKPAQYHHHQRRADDLGGHGGNGRPGHPHFQNDHAEQIHENIHNTGNGQEDERPPGIAHGPQDSGTHVIHHGGQGPGKVQPDIGLGIGQAAVRGAHVYQNPGGGENAQGGDNQSQNQGQGHAGMQGILSSAPVSRAIELGQQHRGAGAEADEEAVQQIHQRGGGAHGGKGLGAYEPAHDNCVHGIVKLLEEGSQQDGEEKCKQLLPDHPFGDSVDRLRRHRVRLLS